MAVYNGTTGNDSYVGGGTNDTLNGDAGNDTLDAGAGNDIVYGGTGNDSVLGSGGTDQIFGDDGNDSMYGGDNNDTVAGGLGDDFLYGGLGSDRLYGGDGADYLRGDGGNELMEGGTGNDTIILSSGTNTITGGTGADTIVGGTGADRYTYALGDGNDLIDDKGGVDVLALGSGITSSDLRFVRNTTTEDLTITVIPTGDVITVKYHFMTGNANMLDSISLFDGSTITSSQIATLTQVLYGTNNAEMILGWAAGCTFNGSGGADTLVGSSGGDTFNFAAGNGNDIIYAKGGTDTLAFTTSGITAANLRMTQNIVNNDLYITVLTTGEVITVKYHFWGASDSLESITFQGGTSMNQTDIATAVRTVYGTSGADSLLGWTGGNSYIGGTGADTIAGTNSNDDFYYASGDGNDVIYTKGGTNSFAFTTVGLTSSDIVLGRNTATDDLTITVSATGHTITVKDHFSSAIDSSLDFIYFNDGSSMNAAAISAAATHYLGTSSAEMMVGWASGVEFHGNAGNDTLVGAAGNDTFHYSAGDGNDLIYAKGGTDTLAFGGSITANDLRITRDYTTENLRIELLTDGSVINVRYHFIASSEQLESITFASGGSLNLAQIHALALNMYGDSGANLMYGLDSQNDIMHGEGGDDSLYGRAGNDELIGGTGMDGLFGGSGADVFTFNAANESGTVYIDVIGDFSHAEGDQIDLTGIGAMSFIGNGAFSGASNQVRYTSDGQGNTLVQVDTNGDSSADMVIKLIGSHTLVSGDFV